MFLVSIFFSSFPEFFFFFLFISHRTDLSVVLHSPHQSAFRMADSACATHAPSPLLLSNNPSPPPLVQHGRVHLCFGWLNLVCAVFIFFFILQVFFNSYFLHHFNLFCYSSYIILMKRLLCDFHLSLSCLFI